MMNNKHIFFTLTACALFTGLAANSQTGDVPVNAHFKAATPEDRRIWQQIKKNGLLFEKEDRTFAQMTGDLIWQNDPYIEAQRKVNNNLRAHYGVEQCLLTTQDNQQIATLVRAQKDAPITIVYVTGYFAHQTPAKEWSAPFYGIFEDCNIVSYDWRSSGQSTGTFSHNAIYDIRAMLELCKTHPVLQKTKVVLASFCLGGALALEALTPLIDQQSLLLPDAFVMSCTPSDIHTIREKDRGVGIAPNAVIRAIAHIGPVRNWMIDYFLDPVIMKLAPVKSLPKLTMPICFEQCATRDSMVPMQDLYDNYYAASQAPVRHVLVSDPAIHVRLHKETPHQYRLAHLAFFRDAGLIDAATYERMQAHRVLA